MLALMLASAANAQDTPLTKVEVTYSEAKGIGVEKDVMRRDPSDIVKVDSTYYVWYTKGAESGGYNGTVWYATSPDVHIGKQKKSLPFIERFDFKTQKP